MAWLSLRSLPCDVPVALRSESTIVFGEHAPLSTWLGLALIVSGGAVIQFGPR